MESTTESATKPSPNRTTINKSDAALDGVMPPLPGLRRAGFHGLPHLPLWSCGYRVSMAGPMQAKTRSAPRTPSVESRSIQSPIQFGSSLKISPQSPIAALSARGLQIRCTLVARAAASRARNRAVASVAMGHEPVTIHPPLTIPARSASHPSVVLCANTTVPMPSSRRTRRPSAKADAILSSKKLRSFVRPSKRLVSS
jgi:hypothetical protein